MGPSAGRHPAPNRWRCCTPYNTTTATVPQFSLFSSSLSSSFQQTFRTRHLGRNSPHQSLGRFNRQRCSSMIAEVVAGASSSVRPTDRTLIESLCGPAADATRRSVARARRFAPRPLLSPPRLRRPPRARPLPADVENCYHRVVLILLFSIIPRIRESISALG